MTGKFNYDLLDKGDISALEESGLIDLIFEHDQEGMYLSSVVDGAPVHVLNWVLSYNIPKEILNKLDDGGFSLLNDAVYRSDKNTIVPVIWALVKAGCDINQFGMHRMTLLHCALMSFDDSLVTALCRMGARMDICDDLGEEGTQIELAKRLGRFHLLEPWLKNNEES